MSGGGKGESQEQSTQSSRSFVDPAQAGFLADLRNRAQNFGNFAAPQAQQFGAQFAGGGGIQQMAEGFGQMLPGVGAAQQALAGFMPGQFQAQNALLDESQVQAQVDQLGFDINQQLQRQIGGAGGVNTGSALAGNLGGGRNQVQRGIANEGALNAFSRGATGLRAADLAQRQGLTNQLALGNLQGALTGQGQQLGAMQAAQQGALGGEALRQQGIASQIGAQGQALNLGLGGISAGLGPLAGLAQIIGGPTVLSEGQAQSTAQTTSPFNLGGFGGFLTGASNLLGVV